MVLFSIIIRKVLHAMRLLNPFSAVASSGKRTSTVLAPHVQICAHTDDDLYFMTPDLWQSVHSGIPQVNVYLTTGEADGINLAMDDAARRTAAPDFAGYTAARQHGIRAAYAFMVTGSRRATWQRSVMKIRGVTAEINRLAEGHITLLFLNLRTGRGAQNANLLDLWQQTSKKLATLRPTSSPIPARCDGQSLTRDALIGTLTEILQGYSPAVVRIMNPDPQWTVIDKKTGGITYCDNSDHTAAALFAMAALEKYERTGRQRPAAVESYVGYCNKLRPRNLSPQQAARKFSYLAVYGGEDGHDCEQPPGLCGDRPLGNRAYNRFYGQSTNYRWHSSTNWLQRLSDGRLAAFAVLGGRPVMWVQDQPGGDTWSGPAPLGHLPADGGRVVARLDATRDAGGRVHVIAVRAAVGPSPEQQQRNLLHIAEDPVTGEFGAWSDIGSPYSTSAEHEPQRRALGMPVIVASGDGVRVAVRNFGTGLSSRLLSEKRWEPWSDLKGSVLEGMAAIARKEGTVEFYGTSSTSGMGVLRWYQTTPGGGFTRDYGTQLAQPAAPMSLIEQPDGSLLMYSRQPGTGWLVANRQHRPNGTWNTQPEIAATTPGFGPLAHTALSGGKAAALIQRTDEHGLSLCVQPLDGSPIRQEWTPLGGGPFVHAPAVFLDSRDRLVIAYIDAQACLTTLTLDLSSDRELTSLPSWSTHHIPGCQPASRRRR